MTPPKSEYVLVPREPTEEMIRGGMIARGQAVEKRIGEREIGLFEAGLLTQTDAELRASYAAMLDEAPTITSWHRIDDPVNPAPKDGTVVDLCINGERYSDCWWGRPHHTCGEAGKYCDCCPSYDGWCDVFGYVTGEEGYKPDAEPTHWMFAPLPPPPDEGGE